MPFYYIHQVKAMNGVPVSRYFRENHLLTERFEESGDFKTATYATVHLARRALSRAISRFGGDWEIVRRAYGNDSVIHREFRVPKDPSEIERDLIRGKHVSSSDINRFAKSARGAMFLSSLNR